MRRFIYFIAGLLSLVACKDLTNTDPEQTDAFIKYYGDSGNTVGNDIKLLSNGDLLILGVNEDGPDLNTFLLRTDAYGNIQSGYPKSYSGFRGVSLEVDANGYYIIGDRINSATDSTSMMLLITNTSGDSTASILVNAEELGSTQGFNFHGTALDISGNVTALGYTQGGILTSLYRVGFDLTDNTIAWTQFLADGPTYFPGNSLVPNSTGHHWVTTRTNSGGTSVVVQVAQEDQPVGNSDDVAGDDVRQLISISGGYAGIGTNDGNVLVFVTDEAGNIIADSNSSTAIPGSGKSIFEASDGSIIILYTTQSVEQGQTDNDFIISKTNADASSIVFSTRVGGSGDEEDGTVIESSNGGYLILGTSTFDGVKSIVLIKTNLEGTLEN